MLSVMNFFFSFFEALYDEISVGCTTKYDEVWKYLPLLFVVEL